MSTFILHFKDGRIALAEVERSVNDLRQEIATQDRLRIDGFFALEHDDIGQTGTFWIDTSEITYIQEIDEDEPNQRGLVDRTVPGPR